MICPNCGSSTRDGSRFCEECGARLEAEAAFQSDAFYGYEAGQMGPAPGYSRRIDSDSVQAALKKNRRVTRLLGVVAVIVPLIGFGIYGKVSDAMELWEALLTGVVISVIMAVTMIIVFLKNKFSKSFEGTLTGKKHTRHVRRSNDGYRQSRHDYILYITDADGKRHKKKTTSTIYNYLNEGDRLRYLPQFPLPFEKYDKSRDAEIPCLFCGTMNPVRNDNCSVCHNPMIK